MKYCKFYSAVRRKSIIKQLILFDYLYLVLISYCPSPETPHNSFITAYTETPWLGADGDGGEGGYIIATGWQIFLELRGKSRPTENIVKWKLARRMR